MLLSFFVATTQAQQSSTASQTVNLKLEPVIQISAMAAQDIDLNFNDISNFANGVQSTSQEFKVQSNKEFVVNVKADASTFTYAGNASPVPAMPVNNTLYLELASNNTGGQAASSFSNFNSLSNTPQDLLLNCKNGGDQRFAINYKASPGMGYPAGTYTVGIVYTATQP